MRIDAVTIFPDYFAPLSLSLVGKAIASGLLDVHVHDLRQWTHDRHRTVDDTPYGGGAGMVMKPEPWGEAIDALIGASTPPEEPQATDEQPAGFPDGRGEAPGAGPGPRTVLVIPTPSGRLFDQETAVELSRAGRLIFACGRYEGIDARVAAYAATVVDVRELSLGDYVLNGGEVAALAMIEAVVRLIPGVVGNPQSLVEESHAAQSGAMLEYPVFTRPESWRGFDVPDVLLSGHHGRVDEWRREKSVELTRRRRPDLL